MGEDLRCCRLQDDDDDSDDDEKECADSGSLETWLALVSPFAALTES